MAEDRARVSGQRVRARAVAPVVVPAIEKGRGGRMSRSIVPAMLTRREILKRTAGLAGAASLGALPPFALAGPAGPWSSVPAEKVDAVSFVGWQYGEIYANLSKKFEADWGVTFDQNLSGFNEYFQKFTTTFAAGAQVDVGMGFAADLRTWAQQGISSS